jgi:hypothetical protein
MMMACSIGCWQLVQLVSIGCHSSMQELVAHLANMLDAKGADETRHAANRSVSPLGKKLTPPSNETALDAQRTESFLAEKLQACLSNKERALFSHLSWKSASDTDGSSSPMVKADYSRLMRMLSHTLLRVKGKESQQRGACYCSSMSSCMSIRSSLWLLSQTLCYKWLKCAFHSMELLHQSTHIA